MDGGVNMKFKIKKADRKKIYKIIDLTCQDQNISNEIEKNDLPFAEKFLEKSTKANEAVEYISKLSKKEKMKFGSLMYVGREYFEGVEVDKSFFDDFYNDSCADQLVYKEYSRAENLLMGLMIYDGLFGKNKTECPEWLKEITSNLLSEFDRIKKKSEANNGNKL